MVDAPPLTSLLEAKLPKDAYGNPDINHPDTISWCINAHAALILHPSNGDPHHWLCTTNQQLALELVALGMAVQGPQEVPVWWHDCLVPQLNTCLQCVIALHDAMVWHCILCALVTMSAHTYAHAQAHTHAQAVWEATLPIERATPLLTALQHCNLHRLETQLVSAAVAMTPKDSSGGGGVGTHPEPINTQALITVLFEVLEYDLAQDYMVNEALTKALTAMNASHDLDLSSGVRYKGLYRLLAHENPSVRSMVCGVAQCIYTHTMW